jgi:hypothetical protein
METVNTSVTLVSYHITLRHIPEDCSVHSLRCENLRSNAMASYLASYSSGLLVFLDISIQLSFFKVKGYFCNGSEEESATEVYLVAM